MHKLTSFIVSVFALNLALGIFSGISADDAESKTTKSQFTQELSGTDLAYFENKIRPLLVKHCYECHSQGSKELGAKLLLDSRSGILSGGESGPALIPGKPEKSLIIQAIEFQGPEMPPEGKLPQAAINELKKWVSKGAPDPRVGDENTRSSESDSAFNPSTLWSFQPRRESPLPAIKDRTWAIDPLDQYILSKMEKANLTPVGDANPKTLGRRLFYDLIGLPPSLAQLQIFEERYRADKRLAIEELVDRLLASPQFGIRWGQHWLDVARYGESNGDDGLGRNASFPHAWRYRDYVVDSLNRDVPYDRFLREQIAGDLLPAETAEERNRNLIATGFLALGSKPAAAMNNDFAMDIVDDQINVVCTSVLGLSVACARCHDHKHDPVSLKDYYALAGIFSSTESLYGLAANEKLTAPATPLHSLYSQLPSKRNDLEKTPKFSQGYSDAIADSKPILHESLQLKPKSLEVLNDVIFETSGFATFKPPSGLKGEFATNPDSYSVSFWFKNNIRNNARPITVYLFSRGQFGDKKLFGDHLGIGGTHEKDVTGKLFVFNGNVPNQKSVKGLTEIEPGTWNHVVLIRNRNRIQLYLNGNQEPEIDSELPKTVGESREFCLGERADSFAPLQGNLAHVAVYDRALVAKEALLLHSRAGQPKRMKSIGFAMGVRDRAKPADAKIHINGSRAKLGPVIPRGVLSVYADSKRVQFKNGNQGGFEASLKLGRNSSGRRELAKWLTNPNHPQTARVMVNRVWLHLFGRGIVETPDDFGAYGARPTHPDLLDHLADRFVANGWSTKRLIRMLVLSRTYRLASLPGPDALTVDPENRLYSFHSRRRLSAEEIRDSILHASNQLDTRQGQGSAIQKTVALINWPIGKSTNFHLPSNRRSLYLCRLRHAPPRELVAFDLPDGVAVTGRRAVTVKPTQSLFFLNDPFVIKQSHVLSSKVGQRNLQNTDRIRELYHQILKREPTAEEIDRSQEFLTDMKFRIENPDSEKIDLDQKALAILAQALLSINEFRYVD